MCYQLSLAEDCIDSAVLDLQLIQSDEILLFYTPYYYELILVNSVKDFFYSSNHATYTVGTFVMSLTLLCLNSH